jgi:predicted ATPase
MKKIVLTGGPCSGKTTIQRALKEEFPGQVLLVPEVATLLLAGGFPVPGEHLPWSPQWQASFQSAVLQVQLALEDTYILQAQHQGTPLVICDRGLLDGAGYTPGGLPAFSRAFGIDVEAALRRYDAVLHLESLATADPEQYGKGNNRVRFEPLKQAQQVEQAIRDAWAGHPRRLLIAGSRGIDSKIAEVFAIIRRLLAETE